jgi:hypothetical protein
VTIFYPDLSHFDRDRGVRLEPGTAAVVAKATQASSLADPAYGSWKQQAAAVGAVFGAYHWLNHGNIAAQARWCHDHVGATPLMIDAEDLPGNTGYNGTLTVADITGFAQAFRALGGTITLVYLPHWYWQQMGSPSLAPLAVTGLAIVSSLYTTYSDNGPGWIGYGGLSPAVWQYTDAQPYGGSTCDFNAYKGTIAQFAALLGANPAGGEMTDFTPADPNAWHQANRIDAALRLMQATNALGEHMQFVDDMNTIKADAHTAATRDLPVTVDLDALAAKVAALLPPPATAAEIAAELIRQLSPR